MKGLHGFAIFLSVLIFIAKVNHKLINVDSIIIFVILT